MYERDPRNASVRRPAEPPFQCQLHRRCPAGSFGALPDRNPPADSKRRFGLGRAPVTETVAAPSDDCREYNRRDPRARRSVQTTRVGGGDHQQPKPVQRGKTPAGCPEQTEVATGGSQQPNRHHRSRQVLPGRTRPPVAPHGGIRAYAAVNGNSCPGHVARVAQERRPPQARRGGTGAAGRRIRDGRGVGAASGTAARPAQLRASGSSVRGARAARRLRGLAASATAGQGPLPRRRCHAWVRAGGPRRLA